MVNMCDARPVGAIAGQRPIRAHLDRARRATRPRSAMAGAVSAQWALGAEQRSDRPLWFPQTEVFFFQAEDGIRDYKVTGVQTCALPISGNTSVITAIIIRSPGAATGWETSPFFRDPTASSKSRLTPISGTGSPAPAFSTRSEEHTSELQSPCNLVCRLLLEKKK